MSTPLTWNQLPWKYRTALNIYRFAILNQQDIRAVIASAGISMSAAFVKKIYSKYKNKLKMPFWSRNRNGMNAAARNLKILEKKVRRIEQGFDKELKTFDNSATGSIGTAGAITCISDMAQGDTSITREGLQIQPRHLQYRLVNTIDDASTTSVVSRIIIFMDTEQHGTIPTVAQLLESDDVNSFIEHDSRPRFRVLRDITISLSRNGNNQRYITGIIKFGKNFRIDYQGTGTGDASMGKNNLYVYRVSSDNTNTPTLSFYSRMRFVDG